MNRISSFLLGMVVGAVLLFLSMNFYIVRTNDGTSMVRKISAKIEMPYYDVRNYSLEDWQNHQALFLALVKANKADSLQDAAVDGLKRQAEEFLTGLSR